MLTMVLYLFLTACGIIAVDRRGAAREERLRGLLNQCIQAQDLNASAAELRELAEKLQRWADEMEKSR